MKRVITYGTFDLFHHGHQNLIARAKELGDYLIVGVTSDEYDIERGKLNVQNSLLERIESVRSTGLVDEVIVEEYEGQKIHDVIRKGVDVFAIGSDWVGQFDYLRDYCEVVYLDRTQGVSSTQLRQGESGPLRVGLLGLSISSSAFARESRYVSGFEVLGVYDQNTGAARAFTEDHQLDFCALNQQELFDAVDAVYVGGPLECRYQAIQSAISAGKHVISEALSALSVRQAEELHALADFRSVVLLVGMASLYSPGFMHLPAFAKSGRIGKIMSVDISMSAARSHTFEGRAHGNPASLETLMAYPLAAAAKLLGTQTISQSFSTKVSSSGKVLLRVALEYPEANLSMKVSPDVMAMSDLIITGSRGYVYVPDPWWKTSYYEVHNPGQDNPRRYYYAFEGEGLRYEMHEFVKMIREGRQVTAYLTREETSFIVSVIEEHRSFLGNSEEAGK